MFALRKLLYDFAVEGGQIVGVAAGDQPLIDHHLLIDPGGTGIAEVSL
jgi:hypothetical protein